MAEQGAMNFLPSTDLTEEEQMKRLEQQTKGNVLFHISWIILVGYIIILNGDSSCDIDVKTLLIIRIGIRVGYSLPTRLMFYYMALKKKISPGTVNILSGITFVPLIIWYFYVIWVFFTSSNNCKSKSFPLWWGFLLLLIEAFMYSLFITLIWILVSVISCLAFAIWCSNVIEKRNNKQVKDIIMKMKGLKLDYSTLRGDVEWCICCSEFSEDSNIMRLPCNPLHYFHKEWISEWIGHKSNWPICKSEITKESLQPFKSKSKQPRESHSNSNESELQEMVRPDDGGSTN